MDARQEVRTSNFKYVPAIGRKQNSFRFFLYFDYNPEIFKNMQCFLVRIVCSGDI